VKKILITGKNSYIGRSFIDWIKKYNCDYEIEELNLRSESWRNYDFSKYDVVIHLAAIVHKKNVSKDTYYSVNRDLAFDCAKIAKKSGVQHFIFFSTMSVFGLDTGNINKETETNPKTYYGKSKLEAENLIEEEQNKDFKVSIIRPPMIYGPEAPGNYPKLSKLSRKIPFFPKVYNSRSMIYIENLFMFLKILIDNQLDGTFHPQNNKYVNTSELVKVIAKVNNTKMFLLPGTSRIIYLLSSYFKVLKKVFGSLTYSKSLDGSPESLYRDVRMNYGTYSFIESIRNTEK